MEADFLGSRTRATYSLDKDVVRIEIDAVKEGVTVFEAFVAYRSGDDVRFYDRICDHNGGNLITTPEEAGLLRCPLHNWRFDPARGRYTNVNQTKEPLAFERDGQEYLVTIANRTLDWPTAPADGDVSLTFLNHACFVVDIAGKLKFATDPWIFGSAFCDGWWLSEPSPDNAIERLEACDFIYISHNHPDHLHAETLKKLSPRTRFVVPNFESQSVARYLNYLGFDVIDGCDFGEAFDFNVPGFRLAMFKSGDFRDDSGLVLSYGDFKAVMAVDCNALNHFVLPRGTTLLASSFAGGASGFPLCFDNYGEAEKARITARNRSAILHAVDKYIEAAEPAFYVPYAGYFQEDKVRDEYVASRNRKNAVADVGRHVSSRGTGFINPLESRRFTFRGTEMVDKGSIPLDPTKIDRAAWYEQSARRFGSVTDREVEAYFMGARFTDDLKIYINLCDSDFNGIGQVYAVDFRGDEIAAKRIDRRPTLAEITRDDDTNRVILDIRAPAFGRIIREFLPWEDFMIGFQARVERWPNVYNSRMWYYFTNVYIVDFARKASFDCSQACEKLNQEAF